MKSLWNFHKALDEQVEDDRYVLASNPKIYIQDSSFYGEGFTIHHQDLGTFKTLETAKQAVEALGSTRTSTELRGA